MEGWSVEHGNSHMQGMASLHVSVLLGVVRHLTAATTRSLPATAAAMGVTGIALLGSFGLERCSSGRIHVIDQGCGIGPI